MKVLISDNLGEAGVDLFRQAEGIDVDVNTGLSTKQLKEIIDNYDGLVIRSGTKVTEDLLKAAKKLKVVGRAGIGLDNVDISAATRQGVVVMNTPTGNVVTTAEHAIAMMMALTRNIPWGTAGMKSGKWEKKKLQGREVFNKVLGIIGFGKIGSIVADRARGLKMKVIIYDPFVNADQIQKAGFEAVSQKDLFARSDYISVHVPKLKDTVDLLNRQAFDQMKDGVMIINCARGGIVNEDDLNDALLSGKVGGAALDVFATEPPGQCRLFDVDRVICTPHLGASTAEAQTNVAVAVAEQMIDYLLNGTIKNAVNVPSVAGELLEKINPYMDLGDKMGNLQAQLCKEPVKELIIEYNGDFQDIDLTPVTTSVIKGFLTPMVSDGVNSVNAPVLAKERGIKIFESSSAQSEDYINLITVKAVGDKVNNTLSGTIFGKGQPKILMINNFRLELIPEGHILLIYNLDKPGAIGGIGTTLGKHAVNIGRMHVGQDKDGERNIIFLQTDTKVSDTVLDELREMAMVKSVMPLEL
ncbi:MAG: phosphoglycerate dehydrogenase [Desulfobacteraceae bacterium]|jgi:D-3-phosphoglycerate dehydrogenase